MLRRAASTVLPLGIRTVASPRAFRSLASSRTFKAGVESANFNRSRSISSFRQFFSKTSTDQSVIRMLNSEIECADEPTVLDIPDSFPFEIHHQNVGSFGGISLTRRYQDEDIKVKLDHISFKFIDIDKPRIPLDVTVSKGHGSTAMTLLFRVEASASKLTIDSLRIKKNEDLHFDFSQNDYFSELDEKLRTAFHKYLEIRGIKPSTASFMYEYMMNKDNKDYYDWLSNLKEFVVQ